MEALFVFKDDNIHTTSGRLFDSGFRDEFIKPWLYQVVDCNVCYQSANPLPDAKDKGNSGNWRVDWGCNDVSGQAVKASVTTVVTMKDGVTSAAASDVKSVDIIYTNPGNGALKSTPMKHIGNNVWKYVWETPTLDSCPFWQRSAG